MYTPHLIGVIQYILLLIRFNDSSRILAVFPTPIKSHQIVFRELTQALSQRGHVVTVITTDPAYSNGYTVKNLIEIDIHNVSYNFYRKFVTLRKGKVKTPFEMSSYMFEEQFLSDAVQIMIKNSRKDSFDLLLIEMCSRPALVFSYLFKAQVVLISSFGGVHDVLEKVSAATHYFLYPSQLKRKINNLSIWEKIEGLYEEYTRNVHSKSLEAWEDKMLQKVVSAEVPSLMELKKNVDVIFLNTHRMWDFNRPVPPNVIYLGGLHLRRKGKLSKGLDARLNSSVDAIYMSFGTNVDPSTLPPEKIRIFTNTFSRLSYTVLWKWNREKLPGQSENIIVSKWFPQMDLLRHPKIKLFITQGGLHSTEEAIDAGVPLLGIPFIGDQWYNTERYESFGIGLKIDFKTITEDRLKNVIETLMNNSSCRENILKLREELLDQPQASLDRAIWWAEYLMRHKQSNHLLSNGAHLSWKEYYEVDFVIMMASIVLFTLLLFLFFVITIIIIILALLINLFNYI